MGSRGSPRSGFAALCALGCALAGALGAPPAGAVSAARAALDARVERAGAALRQGDVEGALGALEELVRTAPDDTRALSLYAQALLVAGRFGEAADALDRLRRLDPHAERLDYFRGLAAYRLQDWPKAAQLLRSALAREPGSGVLHLLYAVTLQELGDVATAEAELARAEELDPSLSGQVAYRRGVAEVRRGRLGAAQQHFAAVEPELPGSALARSAEAFQDWIGGSRDARALTGWLAAGTGYDSNINLAADDDAPSSGSADAPLGLLEAGAGYRVLQTEKLRIDLAQLGGFRFNFGESSFDLAQTRATAGGTYQALPWLRAGLVYAFEYLAADYETYRLTHLLEPFLRIAPFEEHPTRTFFRFEPRNYDDSPDGTSLDRDGFVYRAGFEQTFSLPDWGGVGRSFVRAGYQVRVERTDGDDFDTLGHQPSLTLGIALPSSSLAIVDVRNEWRGYDHPTGQSHRNDTILEISAGVQKRFGERWSAELSYRHARRNSDSIALPSSDYHRDVVEAVARVRF